ncbi:MAG TPA: ergothioneine biosynthesis protein EgtB, partial [Rhodanobacter sp.]|nr:ergothioneine biosynthesis protein EgtB [Rhodanobacter sp.]
MTARQASAPAGMTVRFRKVRQRTSELCAHLSAEDLQVQSMPDASPG